MKKTHYFFTLLLLVALINSCSQEQSLQSYIVESQEKPGFMAVDLSSSFIQFKTSDVSEDLKETLNSIRKINLIGLPYQKDSSNYENEKETIRTILKNSETYKNLMKMNFEGMNVNLYYTGKTDSIDELILFGYSKEVGVGLARVLGEDMNLGNIMKMMEYIKMDPEMLNLKQFNLSLK